MRRFSTLILLVFLTAFVAGCGTTAGPNWLHPGSASDQLRSAKRFDPYPETNIGPSTTNIRPRGFEDPIAEPSRARWQIEGWKS